MRQRNLPSTAMLLGLALFTSLAALAYGREAASGPEFKYVGGTEALKEPCQGKLELGPTQLTFNCPMGSIAVPYDSISLMQYRPDVSKKIWKMKIKWKLKPAFEAPLLGSKRNRYFTLVFNQDGSPHAMVLDVAPNAMRPYLAEIDLKAGKRVEVKSFEEY